MLHAHPLPCPPRALPPPRRPAAPRRRSPRLARGRRRSAPPRDPRQHRWRTAWWPTGGRRRHRRHARGRTGRWRRDGRLGRRPEPGTAGRAGAAGARRARPGGGVHPAGRRPDRRSVPAAGRALRRRATAGSTTTRSPGDLGPGQRGRHGRLRRPGGGRAARHDRATPTACAPATRSCRRSCTTVGATVAAGDVVGTAGEHLHFGARVGDAYVDPAALFSGRRDGRAAARSRCPPGRRPSDEARALSSVAIGRGPTGCRSAASAPRLRWLRRPGGATGPRCSPAVRARRRQHARAAAWPSASDLADRLLFPPPCSQALRRPGPPVGGRSEPGGGHGGRARVDERVGRHRRPAERPTSATTTAGSCGSATRAGARPARRAPSSGPAGPSVHVRRHPGRLRPSPRPPRRPRRSGRAEPIPAPTVDVYAHSLGGLVTRLALVELDRRGVRPRSRLGLVATLASPHRGADLATAVSTASDAPRAGPALDVGADVLDLGLDPDAPVVAQLGEGSDAGRRAGRRRRARRRAAALDRRPAATWSSPSPHTRVDGATNVTVPVGRRRRARRGRGLRRGHGRDRPGARRPAAGLRGVARCRRRRASPATRISAVEDDLGLVARRSRVSRRCIGCAAAAGTTDRLSRRPGDRPAAPGHRPGLSITSQPAHPTVASGRRAGDVEPWERTTSWPSSA